MIQRRNYSSALNQSWSYKSASIAATKLLLRPTNAAWLWQPLRPATAAAAIEKYKRRNKKIFFTFCLLRPYCGSSIAAVSSIAALRLTFYIVNFCRFVINTSRRSSRRGPQLECFYTVPNQSRYVMGVG